MKRTTRNKNKLHTERDNRETTPTQRRVTLHDRFEHALFVLQDARHFIFTMFLVLFFAGIFGFIFPQIFAEHVIDIIQRIFAELGDKRGFALIVHIFLNNVQASFFAMIVGLFFGIFPIVAALINGYVIGFTAQFVAREEGIFILWKLLPHGVFEIPAVVIAMGLGLYLGSRLLEERFLIKDMTKRLVIIFLVCVLLVPFFGFYVAASDSIGLDTAQDFSSFSGTDLTVLFGIALINLLFIACFVFVLMTFLRYKPLRRDLVNCLWAFILIVIPLLIIAGIVEGLLITLLG